MKLLERMHSNLMHYIHGIYKCRNEEDFEKLTNDYRISLKKECQTVVKQSMIKNIGKVEKNEHIHQVYLAFLKEVMKGLDMLYAYILETKCKEKKEFKEYVYKYQQHYKYYFVYLIKSIDSYYIKVKELDPIKYNFISVSNQTLQDYVIMNTDLNYGTQKNKLLNNLEAIRLIKSGKHITSENQKTLVTYSGWGGLPEVFNERNNKFISERKELQKLLTEKEYAFAKAGTLSEHFTPFEVIQFIYSVVSKLGFKGGKILDPAVGSGNFIGLMPTEWRKDITCVDINPVNAEISRHLYPSAQVLCSPFEKTHLKSKFDLIVTNAPFGNYRVYDKKFGKQFLIHDYFILKSISLLNDNGLCVLITSKGTLDKKSSNIRELISKQATLIAAVRLPNTAFKSTANTEVTTDILFLKKGYDTNANYINVIKDPISSLDLNEYFVKNPQLMLGNLVEEIKLYGIKDTTVIGFDNWRELLLNLATRFDSTGYVDANSASVELFNEIENLELVNDIKAITEIEIVHQEEIVLEHVDALEIDIPKELETVKEYAYCIHNSKLYQRENDKLNLLNYSGKKEERLKSLIKVKSFVLKLINLMLTDVKDEVIHEKQKKLNKYYDYFIKEHGYINAKANKRLLREDPDFPLLLSLEIQDKDNDGIYHKADIFTKRTIRKEKEILHVETPAEALATSLNKNARIDLTYMSTLMNCSQEKLLDDLRGTIYLDPGTNNYVLAADYLSGDVKSKLEVAKNYMEVDYKYAVNVEALKRVIPEDIEPQDITFKLGSTWIPTTYYEDFLSQIFDINTSYISVKYIKELASYNISVNCRIDKTKDTNVYGTKRMSSLSLIQNTLNQSEIKIYDTIYDGGDKKRILNKKETIIARQKSDEIKELFITWLYKDLKRRQEIAKIYNDLFNRYKTREYNSTILNYPGMNNQITLRDHQLKSIERIVFNGNTLLGHCVGAGKTFTMIAAGFKLKQLGLANKPVYVVPNHLIEDWAAEFIRLFPTAKILAATKHDFTPLNRKRFFNRIATNDWDAVIIAHSSFKKIPIDSKYIEEFNYNEIKKIEKAILEVNSKYNNSNFIIKQLEATKKRLEASLEDQLKSEEKDDTLTFDKLGIDYIFLDEAHEFKNLYIYTKQRVSGIPQTKSQKAFDMYLKSQYVTNEYNHKGKRGIVFATGTPISNSMVELFTLQRYLQQKVLEKHNIDAFDSWASNFGMAVSGIEVSPDGSGFRMHTRFNKFCNLPELLLLVREFADIKTQEDLSLPVPKHEEHNVECEASEELKEFIELLVRRAERIHNGHVDSRTDNMLVLTSDSKKASLDMRIIFPSIEVNEEYKVFKCAKEVHSLWLESEKNLGTQLVFCDLSTPSKEFNIYSALKELLVQKGIPNDQIAFIHDADTDNKKTLLFENVRKGIVRVLVGSTQKMGAGMNVQNRLIACHNLDCPWRPADLEQRTGRLIRQGNMYYKLNKPVHIFRYIVPGSFDAYTWQTIEYKAKFINQFMQGNVNIRITEDVDSGPLTYSEVKAIASGNPLVMEMTQVNSELQKYSLIHSNYKRNLYEMECKKKNIPSEILSIKKRIEIFKKDLLLTTIPNEFIFYYNSTSITDKKIAGTMILREFEMLEPGKEKYLTHYRGFDLSIIRTYFDETIIISSRNGGRYTLQPTSVPANNMNRIDETLNSISTMINEAELRIESLNKELSVITEEIDHPFKYEAEYAHFRERKMEIDRLIGEVDDVIMDEVDNLNETEIA